MLLQWARVAAVAILACVFGLGMSKAFTAPTVKGSAETQETEDPFMGVYAGTFYPMGDHRSEARGMVIAEGEGRYRVVLRARSGPGDRDWPFQLELAGRLEGERLQIAGNSMGLDWAGGLEGGKLTVEKDYYGGRFELLKAETTSSTAGQAPPPGAVVLLPYAENTPPDLGAWSNQSWRANADGSMQKGKGDNATRRDDFRDIRLHLEFRVPYEPTLRGQHRGNSGVFVCKEYEVQILDSFGLVPGLGDCGAIYNVAPPTVNASFPPMQWQTFDIEFRAPRLDEDGELRQPARITVRHNGIPVHDDQVIAHPTANPKKPNVAQGHIRVQDHRNLLRFRNIWVVELEAE